jgi:HlyD family secretion protein
MGKTQENYRFQKKAYEHRIKKVSKRKISKSSQNGQLNQSIGFMNKSLDIF